MPPIKTLARNDQQGGKKSGDGMTSLTIQQTSTVAKQLENRSSQFVKKHGAEATRQKLNYHYNISRHPPLFRLIQKHRCQQKLDNRFTFDDLCLAFSYCLGQLYQPGHVNGAGKLVYGIHVRVHVHSWHFNSSVRRLCQIFRRVRFDLFVSDRHPIFNELSGKSLTNNILTTRISGLCFVFFCWFYAFGIYRIGVVP
jgi:hypothetical protein